LMRAMTTSLVIVLVLAVGACSKSDKASPAKAVGAAPAEPALLVKVSKKESWTTDPEIDLVVTAEGCNIHLQVEASRGEARLLARDVRETLKSCDLGLNRQLPMWDALLAQSLKEVQRRPPFDTFRIYEDHATYEAMYRRLALAASVSPKWDVHTGKPRTGMINTVIAEIANEAKVFPELAELFAKYGMTVFVKGTEKVGAEPAAKLPYAKWLQERGVPGTSKLPSTGFMLWFGVTATAPL